MIPRTPVENHLARPTPVIHRTAAVWQRLLANAIGSLGELVDVLGLDAAAILGEGATDKDAAAAHRDFPLRVPRGFAERMRPGDPHDPLLRQVLPTAAELAAGAGLRP